MASSDSRDAFVSTLLTFTVGPHNYVEAEESKQSRCSAPSQSPGCVLRKNREYPPIVQRIHPAIPFHCSWVRTPMTLALAARSDA